MIKSNASGIMYGRPYGGVATLIKKSILPDCKCELVNDRIVALSVCNSLFINTYLPCDDGAQSNTEILIEILSVVSDLFNDFNYDYKFVCGDFNTNLYSNRKNSVLVKNLLAENDLKFTGLLDANKQPCFTFSNEKRNCSSQIDYIMLFFNAVMLCTII